MHQSIESMASLCNAAAQNEDFHLERKTKKTDQYRFLYSIKADCVECTQYWLHLGADPHEGTANHPDWNAFSWAEHYKATRCSGKEKASCML